MRSPALIPPPRHRFVRRLPQTRRRWARRPSPLPCTWTAASLSKLEILDSVPTPVHSIFPEPQLGCTRNAGHCHTSQFQAQAAGIFTPLSSYAQQKISHQKCSSRLAISSPQASSMTLLPGLDLTLHTFLQRDGFVRSQPKLMEQSQEIF